MGIFSRKSSVEKSISDSVERVIVKYLTSAENEIKTFLQAGNLEERVKTLTTQLSSLQIEKSRIEEDFTRREREIEHKLGLEKLRQEQDLELGLREQSIKIKEENLTADKARFEAQMKFMTERMSKENDHLKAMMEDILAKLPTVRHDIKEVRGDS